MMISPPRSVRTIEVDEMHSCVSKSNLAIEMASKEALSVEMTPLEKVSCISTATGDSD